MRDCVCRICDKVVTPDDQYLIEHEIGRYEEVVHVVYHLACMTHTSSQGSGSDVSSEVAASTSRSKEA